MLDQMTQAYRDALRKAAQVEQARIDAEQKRLQELDMEIEHLSRHGERRVHQVYVEIERRMIRRRQQGES